MATTEEKAEEEGQRGGKQHKNNENCTRKSRHTRLIALAQTGQAARRETNPVGELGGQCGHPSVCVCVGVGGGGCVWEEVEGGGMGLGGFVCSMF